MAAMKKLKDPYPHKWDVSISIPYLIEKYKDIEAGTHLESEPLSSSAAFIAPFAEARIHCGAGEEQEDGGNPFSFPLSVLA